MKREYNLGLVYKYNKDIQINGTIFYAFEYLIKILEEIKDKHFMDDQLFYQLKKKDLPRLFIVCPNSQKINLKDNYFNLFIKRYPLTKKNGAAFRVNNFYNNEARIKLSKEEYNNFFEIKKLVTKAFSQIKFCTSAEYLKNTKDINTLVFTSYNTYFDLYKLGCIIPEQKKVLFQNRATFQLINENLPNFHNTTLLFETKYQKLETNSFDDTTIKRKVYPLKLGFKYFYPKVFFSTKKYNTKNTLICGKPSANRVNNTNLSLSKVIKPSRFMEVKNDIGFFFDGIKGIDYYRNILKFEENNRIIPEAFHYGLKINIYKEEENINHLNLGLLRNNMKLPDYDTSVTRYNEIILHGLDKYNLSNDNLLKLFIGE